MKPIILFACSIIYVYFFPSAVWKKFQISGFAQGTTYHITYYASDSIFLRSQADSILDKIDGSLSLYKAYSLINRFNASSEGLVADDHLRQVVNRAMDIYKESAGLFDITVYPLTKAWGLGPVKPNLPPTDQMILDILPCVNSSFLYWKEDKLLKQKPCVQLDPNGIAQGYSVDVLARFLEQQGINDYLVELGGEIRIKGHRQPGGEKMSIGIESPAENPENGAIQKILQADKGAFTTSGNYRSYYQSGEYKRLFPTLDPKTGHLSHNELISVTVYAPDAMTADAFDNVFMLMGLDASLSFLQKRKDLAVYFIYERNGKVADTLSDGFYDIIK